MSLASAAGASLARLLRAVPAAALAGLAGLAAVAGFAPFGFSALPILAIAALVLLWQCAPSARHAAATGFAYGLAHFGAGVSWVYVSMHDIGMLPAPLAALATLLFCTILALYPAAVGYVQARLQQRFASGPVAVALLVIPSLWVLGECLRGWLFTGFPWLALGYSQTDTPLGGLAPLAGAYGVSFATALAAGLIAVSIGGKDSERTLRTRVTAIAALAVLLGGGLALKLQSWTVPAGPPLSVALAQGNVPQSLKFEPGRFESTLDTYRQLVSASSAQLTVLPETAIPRSLDLVPPDYLAALEQLARERNGNLLLGAPRRNASGEYTNSVVSLGVAPRQSYSKTHLVPFGEFIPPGFGWLLRSLQIPLSDFTRGRDDAQPLQLGPDLRVAVNICYEDAFGAEIARQLPAATLLVNASNVAWFGDSLAPDQHLQISRMRAMETGRSMLRATNTGVTAIIDERGTVVARLPGFTEGLLQGSAQPFEGATPYVRFGDWPIIALCVLLISMAGLMTMNRRQTPR